MSNKEKLMELRTWFVENPKLPETIDELLLKRFLKCENGDVEKTKRLILHNYTLRNKNPHIFLDRDGGDESPQMKEFHALRDVIPLPGLTKEGYKVLFFRMHKCEPSKMNSLMESKFFYMMADCRFTMLDIDRDVKTKDEDKKEEDEKEEENEKEKDKEKEEKEDNDEDENVIFEGMANGDIQIMDAANLTLSHMARASLFVTRIHMKFLQEAYPVRLRGMHIINCPSYMDKMIAIVRPFIKDEIFNMAHFHTGGIESVYEHIPREMLPKEYGGNAGTIEELKEKWLSHLKNKKEYLVDHKHWKVEEESRSRWLWW